MFWSRGLGASAWGLSAGLLLVIVLLVGATYLMNLWNRAIFDGLQNKDSSAVAWLSVIYFILLAISVALSATQTYLRMALQRFWRNWLNDDLVERWTSRGRYYQLNLVRGDHANPEYRIADDVRIATESPVDFVSGITHALLSAITVRSDCEWGDGAHRPSLRSGVGDQESDRGRVSLCSHTASRKR